MICSIATGHVMHHSLVVCTYDSPVTTLCACHAGIRCTAGLDACAETDAEASGKHVHSGMVLSSTHTM